MATGGQAAFLPEAALGRRELLSQSTRMLCGLREEGPHKGLFVSIKEVVWSLISKVPCTPHALGRQRTLLLYGRAPPCYPTQSRLGPGGQSSRENTLGGPSLQRWSLSAPILWAEVRSPASSSVMNTSKPLCPAQCRPEPGGLSQISG